MSNAIKDYFPKVAAEAALRDLDKGNRQMAFINWRSAISAHTGRIRSGTTTPNLAQHRETARIIAQVGRRLGIYGRHRKELAASTPA